MSIFNQRLFLSAVFQKLLLPYGAPLLQIQPIYLMARTRVNLLLPLIHD
jgi:hypothetical protein